MSFSFQCLIRKHRWTGCTCTACGKTRDEGHDWSENCEKCAKCGNTRKVEPGWFWGYLHQYGVQIKPWHPNYLDEARRSPRVIRYMPGPIKARCEEEAERIITSALKAAEAGDNEPLVKAFNEVDDDLHGKTKPETALAAASSQTMDGIQATVQNYKSKLRPFGNRLRFPSDSLQYILFRDEQTMIRYYGQLKRQIESTRPPKVIEVVLCRLSNAVAMVSGLRAPWAIVWPSAWGGELEEWQSRSCQTVNDTTPGIVDAGSDYYADVRASVVEVVDWDILFPAHTAAEEVAFQPYLVDDPS